MCIFGRNQSQITYFSLFQCFFVDVLCPFMKCPRVRNCIHGLKGNFLLPCTHFGHALVLVSHKFQLRYTQESDVCCDLPIVFHVMDIMLQNGLRAEKKSNHFQSNITNLTGDISYTKKSVYKPLLLVIYFQMVEKS